MFPPRGRVCHARPHISSTPPLITKRSQSNGPREWITSFFSAGVGATAMHLIVEHWPRLKQFIAQLLLSS